MSTPSGGRPPYTGYLFAYFTGDTLEGENIRFALSDGNDALHWTELNGGEPVLRSTCGTGGLRDPFLIRSPDGDTIYLLATDLSIGSGTTWEESQRHGSRYIEVWQTRDFTNWSEQRHIKVSDDTAGNVWAPEAVYDESIGAYFVFWASKLYSPADPEHAAQTENVMLASLTQDFVTFTNPQVWQDPGTSVIDTTVLRERDVFHRFTKDEGRVTGCSDILHEVSAQLSSTSPSWTTVARCIGRDAGLGPVEGPIAFAANAGDVSGHRYYLFVDEYVGRGYVPLVASTLDEPVWRIAHDHRLPPLARHGSILPVTDDEQRSLRALRETA